MGATDHTAGSKGRIAWCVSPRLSGVTTVYQVIGGGLRRAGWDVVAVSVGVGAAREFDQRFAVESFEILAPDSSDVRRNAAEFIHWVDARQIDVVFCTGQAFTLAAAPALPSHVRMITRVANMTRRGYELATANLARIDRIVVETPRQQKDLIRSWAVPPEKCAVIPGGIEVETYSRGTIRDFQGSLRLIYLGRLEENQKAVLLFPRMARRLAESGVKFHFDLCGEGPDEARLKAAFGRSKLLDRVTFHGALRRPQTLPILQQAHVLLLTSRFEGVPWALLEGMACGCVPVVSKILGTTDFVVDHGVNGLLCTVGDAAAFAREIGKLAADRKRLEALSGAATQTIRERFTVERAVRDHEAMLGAVLAQEPSALAPMPVSEIQAPKILGSGWRRWVPQPVKNYLRTWAERFHWSV
jgi:glycosyltransferase involved in cell wall biosynthesis